MNKNDLAEQRVVLIPVEQYKRLLALCARAADALEGYWPVEQTDINALIAELREAAQ